MAGERAGALQPRPDGQEALQSVRLGVLKLARAINRFGPKHDHVDSQLFDTSGPCSALLFVGAALEHLLGVGYGHGMSWTRKSRVHVASIYNTHEGDPQHEDTARRVFIQWQE